MPLVHRVVHVALIAPLLLAPRPVEAQQHSRSATVPMSLRVLARASFEGGTEHPLSAQIVGGEALRVQPADGVRTRMTYNAPTRVVVAGSRLVGPGGASVAVRYVCAIGTALSVSAAEPFDCASGTLAVLVDGRASTVPLGVGAELTARETTGLPSGVYAGRVTLTAVHPAH